MCTASPRSRVTHSLKYVQATSANNRGLRAVYGVMYACNVAASADSPFLSNFESPTSLSFAAHWEATCNVQKEVNVIYGACQEGTEELAFMNHPVCGNRNLVHVPALCTQNNTFNTHVITKPCQPLSFRNSDPYTQSVQHRPWAPS